MINYQISNNISPPTFIFLASTFVRSPFGVERAIMPYPWRTGCSCFHPIYILFACVEMRRMPEITGCPSLYCRVISSRRLVFLPVFATAPIQPSRINSSAMAFLRSEYGMLNDSRPTALAFRIRVNMSAIGSILRSV